MLRWLFAFACLTFSFTNAQAQLSAMPNFMPSATGNIYVGGGVGYGGASRNFSLMDGFACPTQSQVGALPVLLGGQNGCTTSASGFGFTLHGLLGYTMPGWIGVSGVEIRARIGQEAIEGALGGTRQLSPTVTNTAFGVYRTSINGGVAVSGRLGANIAGFIPFVRGGVGVVHISESLNFDATGAKACASCTAMGGKIDWSKGMWAPSMVLGLGLEVPVTSSVFLRAEGEIESIFHPGMNFALIAAKSGGNVQTIGQAAIEKDNWIFARRLMLSAGMRF